MERFIQHRTKILLIIGLLTMLFVGGITQLKFSFSFEGFFPKEDVEYQYYEAYRERFFEDQNYMIPIAVEAPEGNIFDREFLAFADSFFSKIETLPGIDSMSVATRVKEVRRRGLGLSSRPYLRYGTDAQLEASRKRVSKDSLFIGIYAGRSLKHICGYFYLDKAIFDSPERDHLSRNIDGVVEAFGVNAVISGIPYIRTQYIEKLSSELLLFMSLSALLLMLALVWLYRSFWGVALPLLTAFAALAWTLGLMGFTDEPLGILSNLLIPIIFVVSMSDVIHLMTKYQAMIEAGHGKYEALKMTLRQIGLATFLTSLTTSIGFGALMISRMEPIGAFGLYAAIGVLFTFVVAVGILTFSLPIMKPGRLMRKNALAQSAFWDQSMGWMHRLLLKRPLPIVLMWIGILALSIFYTSRIPLDNYLMEDMSPRDKVQRSMAFYDEEFYGMRAFEMAIHTKGDFQVTDREVLVEMAKIQDHLAQHQFFSPFFSAASFVQNANFVYHYNRPQHFALPDSQSAIDELLNLSRLNGGGPILDRIIGDDGQMGRISTRLPDIGTGAFQVLRKGLEDYIATECDTAVFSYHITGHAMLTERNLVYLRDSLLQGLLIAFIIVAVIMGLLFRSWKMLLISIVPNVVPLLLTGGVMGLFGISLSSSTSIVFVISFGIAVDDTIHFLTRFRLERDRGLSVDDAIRATMLGTGKAMILTSIVLLGGFVLLMASDFGGTFNTGFFTALTILFALLSDLLLLPLLLWWVFGRK